MKNKVSDFCEFNAAPYSIEEHIHRFSAWTAGRAASVNGFRFTVHQAKVVIEAIGLNMILADPANLPSPKNFDSQHKEWRNTIVTAFTLPGRKCTHGVAAKLINVYLKTAFVCSRFHTHINVQSIHPPIDRILLTELLKRKIGQDIFCWKQALKIGWSKFDSDEYQMVIDNIRRSIPNRPMWEIEQYWKGHQ
jgi:hypothetical protein